MSTATAASPKATPSVDYINPFISGVIHTWKTMLACEPTRGALQLVRDNQPNRDITAIVGLSGPANGTVALRFPVATAATVAQRMLGETHVSDEAVVDVISELVNIVGGAAKAQFTSTPPILMGLPTVIRGTAYRVEHKSGVKWLAVPFASELGAFTLEVAFEPPTGSKK